MSKAFILDRDGTINFDSGYIADPKKLVLLPGAATAIKIMCENGFKVIVVSNQSGVARGYFPIATVDIINQTLNTMLEAEGGHIDAFYYCPHLASGIIAEYAVECGCRKPKRELFEAAIRDFCLDPTECYACGDKPRDVESLPELGVPRDHLGILDASGLDGHDTSLLAFTCRVLGITNTSRFGVKEDSGMGEKIKKIAEIQLGGNRFDIELNHSTSTVGEREIHLQNDCFRVAFSEHEFLQLASGILLARRQLQQIKGEQLQRLGAAEGKPI